MESSGLTSLQRLHESSEIIGQVSERMYAGKNVRDCCHDAEQGVPVSWKGNNPSPLTQTLPFPCLKPGAHEAAFCQEVQLHHLRWSYERQPLG